MAPYAYHRDTQLGFPSRYIGVPNVNWRPNQKKTLVMSDKRSLCMWMWLKDKEIGSKTIFLLLYQHKGEHYKIAFFFQ
ncbi:TPA: hypothetical protein DEP21_01615 [Patescibacteria group bacterium]|nr:hypothetical protein [Candidatus Gracilibacteria bacterium]